LAVIVVSFDWPKVHPGVLRNSQTWIRSLGIQP